MAGGLARLRAMPARERFQLSWMAATLPLVHGALRVFGYARTRAWLERHSQHPAPRVATPTDLESAHSAARIAAIAGRRGLVTATCLRQALLVYWLLRRRGLQPELRIGVRRQADAFDAHAWVELDGHPLQQSPVVHSAFVGKARG
jgi:hypothetical protein